MALRIIFMGSPAFSVPILQKLVDRYEVAAVITQPDKPAGRGRELTPCPVKVYAQNLNTTILQPEKLRDPEIISTISRLEPSIIILAAYGKILKQELLDLPKLGCLNVHASLLPRWRGASPIQAAILNGDAITGVTIMKMDAGLDTGDILSQEQCAIDEADNSETLTQKLAVLGGELLIKTLPKYINGDLPPIAQPAVGVTYAPMLDKTNGLLDFKQPAVMLERKIRAYFPWPGCYFVRKNLPVKVHLAKVCEETIQAPGQPMIGEGYPIIGTKQGGLMLIKVQPAGKNSMDGKAFLSGTRDWLELPITS